MAHLKFDGRPVNHSAEQASLPPHGMGEVVHALKSSRLSDELKDKVVALLQEGASAERILAEQPALLAALRKPANKAA